MLYLLGASPVDMPGGGGPKVGLFGTEGRLLEQGAFKGR